MSIKLTHEQSRAVERFGADAAPVTDPRTRKAYVLVRANAFRRTKRPNAQDDDALADAYPAQIESAMKAGWSDPRMAAYDDYDARRNA